MHLTKHLSQFYNQIIRINRCSPTFNPLLFNLISKLERTIFFIIVATENNTLEAIQQQLKNNSPSLPQNVLETVHHCNTTNHTSKVKLFRTMLHHRNLVSI